MQTTAVQWLAEMLEDCRYRIEDAGHLIDQANKMFEQQMKEAVLNQVTTHPRFRKIFEEQFEHWFNETYGSKGSDDQVPDVRNMAEISDEEIEEESWRYREVTKDIEIPPNEDWSNGAKWYREQLKKKQ